MKTEKPFDLVAAVREYIATATPEQVAQDLRDSDFEVYRGIGPKAANAPIGQVAVETKFMSSFSWSEEREVKSIASAMPFASQNLQTTLLVAEAVCGVYEEMPLAA